MSGDKKSMAAITTFFNPVEGGADQILTFYSNKAGQLAFESIKAKSHPVVKVPTDADTERGVIRNPSQVVAIKYDRLVRIFGIADDTSEIVLLSPGYKSLDISTESKFGSLAACSDQDQIAYIYYLSGNPTSIIEYGLHDNSTKTVKATSPISNTSLAACFDGHGKKRHLIFQPSGTGVTETKLTRYEGAGKTFDVVENSDNANANAAIAVVAHPLRSQIHIYYTSKDDKYIHRISWTGDGRGYSSSKSLSNGQERVDFTNISVTATETDIHLFYVFAPDNKHLGMAYLVDA